MEVRTLTSRTRWKFLIQLRDFLLFLPAGQSSLRGVLSYYTATGNVNQEGDVTINDTLQGFGRLRSPLFHFTSTQRLKASTPAVRCGLYSVLCFYTFLFLPGRSGIVHGEL